MPTEFAHRPVMALALTLSLYLAQVRHLMVSVAALGLIARVEFAVMI